MAVLCASVKRAELLEPGDVINFNGAGEAVESVHLDDLNAEVWVRFAHGQVMLSAGHQIEYVTAEQWENA